MKLFKNLFLPILFIIFSCDDAGNTLSNVPGEFNKMYEFNLMFSGDTEDCDNITLIWDENEDISIFKIEIDGDLDTASKRDSYTFLLLPGLFKDVIIAADNVLIDTIQVFSAPMAPSTWQPDFVDDIKVTESFTDSNHTSYPLYTPYNQFEWICSIENDIEIVQLQKCGYENSPIECSELSNFTFIESFNSEDSIYFEIKNFGEKACYIINSTDLTGNSRYSQIICNDLTPNTMENINDLSVSNNLENKISIKWSDYTNSNFYQYTIYRSENEEMDEASRIVLAEIIDATQTVFEDRNDIGIGKTWYYQIEVHNQFGRIKKSSIISGKSKP